MRVRILMLLMLLCFASAAPAQVNIDINFSVFPELVRVPDYPVYYAPRQNANYFFYDGMYWVYDNDQWYSSDWYNGPWYSVAPEYVPLYVLRVPVRYYRRPPAYFGGWRRDAPPRWGEHWGHGWEQQHSGWDKWNRRAAPAPAPLPTYQRQYSGNRYPRPEEQRVIHDQKYHYQPRDASVREHVQPQIRAAAPAPAAQPERRNENAKDARAQRPEPGKDGREQRPAVVNPPASRQEPEKQREMQRTPAPAGERQPEARKDYRQDAREREQKSAPPARPPEPAARPQAVPAPRERPPEPRKEERPAAREREQPRPAAQPPRPQPQAAPREAPPPRPAAPPPQPHPAAPPPRPAAPAPQPHPPAAPAGKGPEREHEKEEHK